MSTYACPECGTTDVSRFHKNRSTESGLQTHCYKCQKLLWGDRHAKLERFRQHEREAEARETLELRDLLNERLDKGEKGKPKRPSTSPWSCSSGRSPSPTPPSSKSTSVSIGSQQWAEP